MKHPKPTKIKLKINVSDYCSCLEGNTVYLQTWHFSASHQGLSPTPWSNPVLSIGHRVLVLLEQYGDSISSLIQPRPGRLQRSHFGNVHAAKIFHLSDQGTTFLALAWCRTKPQKHLGSGCRSANTPAPQKHPAWGIKCTVFLSLGSERGHKVRWCYWVPC